VIDKLTGSDDQISPFPSNAASGDSSSSSRSSIHWLLQFSCYLGITNLKLIY